MVCQLRSVASLRVSATATGASTVSPTNGLSRCRSPVWRNRKLIRTPECRGLNLSTQAGQFWLREDSFPTTLRTLTVRLITGAVTAGRGALRSEERRVGKEG